MRRQFRAVRMEVYEHGYHDFCLGPQARSGPIYPWGRRCSDSALDALEKSALFVKGKLK